MLKSKAAALTERQIERISRALAEPRRLQILKQIGAQEEPTPCCDILECHKVSGATISHHLKELEAAGLISVAKVGKFMNMSLNREVLQAYRDYLAEI